MPVFRHQEIFLAQTRDRAAILAGHHHIEHDNLRIRFENLTSAIVLGCSLAVKRRGKEGEAQEKI